MRKMANYEIIEKMLNENSALKYKITSNDSRIGGYRVDQKDKNIFMCVSFHDLKVFLVGVRTSSKMCTDLDTEIDYKELGGTRW